MKYTEYLLENFYNPVGCGTISGAHVVAKIDNKESGDVVKFFFVFENEKIKELKYQACGSVVLFASLSAISSLAVGKTLSEALEINEKQIIKEIKQVNRCDYSTISFAVQALNKAVLIANKKIEKGVLNLEKKVKVKNLTTSKDLKIYGEEEVQEEPEIISPSAIEEDEDVSLPAPIVLAHEDDEVVEESIEPLGTEIPEKQEIIESIPTKIEVRVVEEEDSLLAEENIAIIEEEEPAAIEKADEPVLPVKKPQVDSFEKKETNHPLTIEDQHGSNDDVIDEIDSITAKLTDAITKLNFKFDVDED